MKCIHENNAVGVPIKDYPNVIDTMQKHYSDRDDMENPLYQGFILSGTKALQAGRWSGNTNYAVRSAPPGKWVRRDGLPYMK